MPRKELVIPAFRTEAEEAAWWDSHRARVEAEMRRQIKEGAALNLGQMLAKAKASKPLQPVTLRLPTEDIDAARRFAAEKGVGYQTYIKLLLREALQREGGKKVKVGVGRK